MCKILVMSGIKKANKDKTWEFLMKMGKEMSLGNSDGLGYSAVDSQGNMYGERWWYNHSAFHNRKGVTKPVVPEVFSEQYKGFLELESDKSSSLPVSYIGGNSYNSFGTIPDDYDLTAITLHTRAATSGKEFVNTHPFVDVETDTSLIHNGVIRNIHKEDLKTSTCDSEKILNLYVKHDIVNKPAKMDAMSMRLNGYYACAVFAKDKKGNRILDVFKDNSSSLNAVYIKELENLVITTSLYTLESVCKELDLTIEYKYKIKEGVLLRVNPLDGSMILTQEFNCKTVYESELIDEAKDNRMESWFEKNKRKREEKEAKANEGAADANPLTVNQQIDDIIKGKRILEATALETFGDDEMMYTYESKSGLYRKVK